MTSQTHLRLIIIDDTPNDAEELVAGLRNNHMLVRHLWVEDEQALTTAMNTGRADMILCSLEQRRVPLKRTLELALSSGLDLPVIAVSKDGSIQRVIAAIKMGARDLVSRAQLGHLKLVVEREIATFNLWQELALAESKLDEMSQRAEAALENSDAAILYVQEGVVTRVNPAGLRLFGAKRGEQMTMLPISEFIAKNDREAFGNLLRRCIRGETELGVCENMHMGIDEKAFRELNVEFRQISVDGERCTQLNLTATTPIAKQAAPSQSSEAKASETAGQTPPEFKTVTEQQEASFAADTMTLAFQPIVSLDGSPNPGQETLLRLQSADGQTVSAAAFLPAATAHAELAVRLDRWVIAQAMDLLSKSNESDGPAKLFINLFSESLLDPSFLDWFGERLHASRATPTRIIVEVPETVVHTERDALEKLNAILHETGAGLALDHFGTISEADQVLDELQVEYLKLHSSFTRKIDDLRPNLEAIVRSAKAHNVKTVAQHVEGAESLVELFQIGVDYAQGHYIGKPSVVLSDTWIDLSD